MEFIISLILGMIPEVLYYYFIIKNTLNIKNKKWLLILIIFIIYMITTYILNYNVYMYMIFLALIYICLSIFKKRLITDFFVIIFAELYLLIISCGCYFLIPNYTLAFIINRILLFIPILFSKKIQLLYIKYKSMWNRSIKKKNPIKSITLRNISLMGLNLLVLLTYFVLLYISSL